MIFVTVGAQMPFDRLVSAVDDWAGSRGHADVFAQIGPTSWRPRHIAWVQWLEPTQFLERMRLSDVIVAHAGMGSIITALDLRKPILVMPRQGDLGETRNDHQIATARRFLKLGRVSVAIDEHDIADKLDELSSASPAERSSIDGCTHYAGTCPLRNAQVCTRYFLGHACPNLLLKLRRWTDDDSPRTRNLLATFLRKVFP